MRKMFIIIFIFSTVALFADKKFTYKISMKSQGKLRDNL